VEAFDLAWQRRADVFVDLDARDSDPATVVERIAAAVGSVVREASFPGASLLGVGVSVPGVVERTTDASIFAPAFGWDGLPLGRRLRDALDGPVLVDNGAKAMGQAEMWFGAGRGASDAVIALLGIGVGAAVFTGGRLYRGSRSSAGEWGHTPIVLDGDACRCGSSGCLEAYVGETAVLRFWDDLTGRGSTPPAADGARIDELFARASSEPEAAAATARFAHHLGAGLATLVNLFNPETIVLAGSVGLRITPAVLGDIRRAAERYSLPHPFESVRIVRGQLGHDAVALGAATLVVDHHLANGFKLTAAAPSTPQLAGTAA
jgi:predicted NBD/HSP70 family sugar kinase